MYPRTLRNSYYFLLLITFFNPSKPDLHNCLIKYDLKLKVCLSMYELLVDTRG